MEQFLIIARFFYDYGDVGIMIVSGAQKRTACQVATAD
jgi:hypothetical protein